MPASSTPLRHGANRTEAASIARPLAWLIGDRNLAEPDKEQWQHLGQTLLQGDPLADDVVNWLHATGFSTGRHLFEQALNRGINSLANPPPALQALFARVDKSPEWLDRERLQRGLDASARSGKTGMRVLRDLGLMAGYQASAINQTLVKTGALEKGASRRIAETTKWWMDCMTPGGLDRNGEGFKTTLRVRVIHAQIRRQLLNRQDWDCARWGLPVNQLDMQATYLAFSVLFILGQRLMGTLVSSREAEDIMHLWRYIGWLMGVDSTLLSASLKDGYIALYQNLLSQATADETSQQLGRALMDEPLGRHYPHFGWLLARWDKQVHLSMVRWFVGRRGMKALGLPVWTLPWYPLMFAPANAVWCLLQRALPGGRQRLSRWGRQAQKRQQDILFGQEHRDITQVAGHQG
ncbi:oxygenase MpaB family protein [Mangrovitalea sediminis]|uniref:oxygenase MpaB family protein n=1 Tax=Mangrovitalea sediminis TaxID=1982043 RepID=UPI000BE5A443|nr:oxygenase MpaB family protein [Mangrovitalea sediminis]